MTFKATVTAEGNLLLEQTIPPVWRPEVGNVFYMPDLNSSEPATIELDGQGSRSDQYWLSRKNVFKTKEDATDAWHVQAAVAWLLAAD